MERVYTRRQMQAMDRMPLEVDGAGFSDPIRAKLPTARFALTSSQGVRYPGLTMVIPHGRVLVELLLEIPTEQWLDEAFEGYSHTPQIVVVIMLSPAPGFVETIDVAARSRGVEHLIRIQRARLELYDLV